MIYAVFAPLLVLGFLNKKISVYVALVPLLIGPTVMSQILGQSESSTTLQKTLVLFACVVFILRLGIRKPPEGVVLYILFVGIWTAFTLLMINELQYIDSSHLLNSLVGYIFPLLPFFVIWGSLTLKDVCFPVAILPLLALLVGVFLDLAGIHSLFYIEYSGAARLSTGAGHAYLAAIGMFGVFAGLVLWITKQSRFSFILVLADLLITGMTLTRGAIVVAIIVFVVAVMGTNLDGVKFAKITRFFALLISPIALFYLYEALLPRFVNQGSLQGSSSGRDRAWPYFWSAVEEHPWLGNGVGANSRISSTIPDAEIRRYFGAPHNTYLQLIIDFGWIGASLIGLALLVIAVQVFRKVDKRLKRITLSLYIALLVYAYNDNLLSSTEPAFLFGLTMAMLWNTRALLRIDYFSKGVKIT